GGPQAPLVYDLTAGHDQRHLLVRSRGDGGTRGVRGRDRAELPAAGRGARLRRVASRAHVADDDLAAQLPVGAARCLPVGGDPAPPRPAGGTVRSGPSRSGWPGRRQFSRLASAYITGQMPAKRSNSPFRAPPRKARHSPGVKLRTGPVASLLSRTPIWPPSRP